MDSIATLLLVPSVMINRVVPPDLEVFRSNTDSTNPFPSGTRMPMLGIYCAWVAENRQRLRVDDARKEAQWADSPTAGAGIFSYLGYPVLWPNGEVFGTICAIDTRENKWEKQSDSLIQTFRDTIELNLALVAAMEELNKKNQELELALTEVKTLQGLLPICAYCKKIRDDKGYWSQIESYIGKCSGLQFSHGVCPECAQKVYSEIIAPESETETKPS
ncbi:MAG: GAF domain-containing protein [Candidatus Latescibacterota bacterium]